MLIDSIRKDESIGPFLCNDCRENDVSIEIEDTINADDILIIKVDDYYNRLVHNPPPSPDCLIIQRCSQNTFIVYIVELKNIESPKFFKVENIKQKFLTCLEDFMSVRFTNHFHDTEANYKNIHLIFIADPYDFKRVPIRQEKIVGYRLDALLSQRIPKYFGKHLYINHKLPNPKINNCKTIQV